MTAPSTTAREAMRDRFVTILSPAIDARAPYAKYMINALVDAALEAAAGGVAEGWRLVPQSALDWLFGSGPDANGTWFGDEPYIDISGKFWWRTKFRKMLSAAPPPPAAAPRRVGKIGHIDSGKHSLAAAIALLSDATAPEPGGYAVSPSDPTTILAGIRQFGLASDGSDLRDLATAIEAAETRVRELEGEMQRRTDEWAALLHSANEARRRGEAALATERERADKLWDALLWLDTTDPELTAAAEAKFGLDMRNRTFLALKPKETDDGQ